MNSVMKIKKLSAHARIPKVQVGSAGMDLPSAVHAIIPAKSCQVINTDLAISMPRNCYGHIAPRSGLAANRFIGIGGGVIDQSYRGNIGVIIFNHGANKH